MTGDTFHHHYRKVKELVERTPDQAILRILDLEVEVYEANRSLAGRLQQIGFTERCSMHDRAYSEFCGGCSQAKIVAEYGTLASTGKQA